MSQTCKHRLMGKAIKSFFKISEKDHTRFILFFRVIDDVKKKSNIFSYIPPFNKACLRIIDDALQNLFYSISNYFSRNLIVSS